MLELLVAVAFSAAPLTIYLPPVRNLNHFLETAQLIVYGAISYALIIDATVRAALSRF
ncbi:hypothetical protein M569_00578, partial [Genlisea aurea]